MKDENIKEILEDLEWRAKSHDIWYFMEQEKCKILYDYITNLQEENQHLDEVNCKLRVVIEELKTTNKLLLQQKRRLQKDLDILDERKDKAIEYIKRCRDYHRDIHKEEKIFPDEITSLLMILQGEDKDE